MEHPALEQYVIFLVVSLDSKHLQGLDVRGVDGVIQYGICTEVPENFQRGGRGGRDRDGFSFFLMMVEPWATSADLTAINDKLNDDPDRPLTVSMKKTPPKQERCGIASLRIAQSPECIRAQFARYFDDTSPEGKLLF